VIKLCGIGTLHFFSNRTFKLGQKTRCIEIWKIPLPHDAHQLSANSITNNISAALMRRFNHRLQIEHDIPI